MYSIKQNDIFKQIIKHFVDKFEILLPYKQNIFLNHFPGYVCY